MRDLGSSTLCTVVDWKLPDVLSFVKSSIAPALEFSVLCFGVVNSGAGDVAVSNWLYSETSYSFTPGIQNQPPPLPRHHHRQKNSF